jgi:uncharacterized RDD family membrane protein YckC
MTTEAQTTACIRRRVGFGRRLGAVLLDTLIVLAVGLLAGYFLGELWLQPKYVAQAAEVGLKQGIHAGAQAGAQESQDDPDPNAPPEAVMQAVGGATMGVFGVILGAACGAAFGLVVGLLLGVAILGLANALVEGLTGATAGKRIMGIRIVDSAGGRATLVALLTRCALKYINLILFLAAVLLGSSPLFLLGQLGGLVILIGCFFVLGRRHQALHDLLANTAVVKLADVR